MSKKITKKTIVANWKMNPRSLKEAKRLFSNVAKSIFNTKKTEIIICPPFLYLPYFANSRSKKVSLGAQDAFFGDVGAYTGEVSSEMLYDIGVRYVILGHSERRGASNGIEEKDDLINKKTKTALATGLIPILCVGENVRDENHEYFNIVKTQVLECLNGISKDSVSKIIIAYEPVWSISTTPNRKDATPEDFLEMSIFIKKVLSDKFGTKIKMPRIIYGGSVNDKNVSDFIKHKSVDGVLVGNASLDAKKFSEIIKICEALDR